MDPRFEDALYETSNKVKVILDILANKKHREVLTNFVLLAKDPILKTENKMA